MADPIPLSWKIRRYIWDSMFLLIFKKKVPEPILPPKKAESVAAIPMDRLLPEIPIRNIMVADHVPGDEYVLKMHLAYGLRRLMYKYFPANQPGLPGIDPDMDKAIDDAFNNRYQELYDKPVLPPEFQGKNGPDLGAIATDTPYACFLERKDGGLVWDFSDLAQHDLNPELRSVACTVLFELDPEKPGKVRPVSISYDGGTARPGDPNWADARAVALCAASTQVSLVRHFNWVHLACGAHFAMVTRNHFEIDHPLCRMVWPHMYGTQNSNYLVTLGQMLPRGEFESIFSFTHKGMCDLFARTHYNYNSSVIIPDLDLKTRGLADLNLDSPVQRNLQELYDVMFAHTKRYIDHYYPPANPLQNDGQVINWLSALHKAIPNGILHLAETDRPENITNHGLARLTAGLIYLAAVQHEALGSVMWNYQLWVDRNPVRIYKDGRRLPIDIMQRLLNANFNLNVNRAKLTDNLEAMGLDATGHALFTAFKDELVALDKFYTATYGTGAKDTPEALEQTRKSLWLIRPSKIDANINA